VVLLDVQLTDLDGFVVATRLTSQDDPPIVVLTSSRDGSEFVGQVARSGAERFVPKAELSGPALEALLRPRSVSNRLSGCPGLRVMVGGAGWARMVGVGAGC
jgi:CheY-like chemotaxis protein